ncbi:MAG: cob(I)alamin adenosyltransferase [Candidatus Berkelbacteria bacterium Athens1014_28]|uniref:Cob(I)alamin adenosyltransferase n=1 Tax=Candidatus Berkelbacteria bacterium Athens1014_28 TaxID=2017145 RepID=A0A554LN19_9BACT|nr:MAG: cob(I)alamin adenosyltransferase [Candidatus Berkelbacteria bacterium Athens1014_28]
MLIVYTGSGKGKSTAAFGLAIRAAGWGKKVAIIQFIKGYKNTGEWKFFQKIPEVDIFQFHDDKKISITKPNTKHKPPAKKALDLAKVLICNKQYDVVILDEINNAIKHGLVEVGEIIKILRSKPKKLVLVLTGRDANKEVIKLADIVTEMKEVSHHFSKNIPAKKGIDY